MTMAQGELFNGDEESTKLSAFASDGQSQSKEAKYHRAYRQDPKNKDRINSQKKRRRALKKEMELGSVSSMFESAARPITDEQQTIDNSRERTDEASLSDSGLDSSLVSHQKGDPILADVFRQLAENRKELENQNREKLELKAKLEACVAKILEFPDNKELAEANAKVQKTIAMQNELAAIKQRLHEILDWQNKNSKTASPTLPINNTEKRNASGIANANDGSLTDQNGDNQADTHINQPTAQGSLEKQEQEEQKKSFRDFSASSCNANQDLPIKDKPSRKPFSTILVSATIILLLGLNTFFLVFEQTNLYESMSYSAGMAMMIAVLSEASLISLSALASWTTNLEWKVVLTTGMVAMLAVMVGILDSSAKNRSNTAARQSQEAKNIEIQLTTLRALEAPIIAQIKSLDPEVYPTKINRLSSQLTTAPNGYSYKIEKLSQSLASINTAEADTSKLIWQRRVALLINLIFSAFLGSLWSSRSSGLIMNLSRWAKRYFSKPCET